MHRTVSVHGFGDAGAMRQEGGWPLGADSSQQLTERWGPSLGTARKWTLPTTGMNLGASRKEYSPSWHLDFFLVRPWAENPVTLCPDSWPTESWANERVLFWAAKFGVICYAAIKKHIQQHTIIPTLKWKLASIYAFGFNSHYTFTV